jgi:hypothetical protein
MSAALTAQSWARALEQSEARRLGVTVRQARARVARQIGTTPSALEHVARGRAKRITVEFFTRLQAAIVQKLQSEIAHAQHELHLARQSGVDPRSPAMAALEAETERATRQLAGRL